MPSKKDKITIDDISITNFIFHIVHHDSEEPILMDKTPIGKHEKFFKERICEIVNGNQFLFTEDSQFLSFLKDIDTNPFRFDEISRILAQQFHKPSEEKDGRIKAGAMIFIKAVIEDCSKYIVIKYDNDNVLTYNLKGNEALLEEISNTFSRNKSALQKSAIIDLGGDEPIAILIDKSSPAHITGFFKNFLTVKRKYSERDLTDKVKNAFLTTAKVFKDSFDKSFLTQLTSTFHEVIKNNENFHAEEFAQAAFGALYKPEILIVFEKNLKKENILGEVFKFDKNFPIPSQRKFSTEEGITIQIPQSAEGTFSHKIEIDNLGQERIIITIVTTKLIEEYAKSNKIDS